MLAKSRLLIAVICTFIVFATTAVFRWHFLSYSHDEQRSVQLILIFAIGLFCLFEVLRKPQAARMVEKVVSPISAKVLLLFFAIGLVSAANAKLPAWALLEWAHWFLLLATCVALALAFSVEARYEDYLFTALILAAGLYGLQVVIQYFVSVAITHKLDSGAMIVGISHRRFAAQFQAALIPVLGAAWFKYAFRNDRLAKWAKPGLLLLAGFAWALCIVTASRGAAVALVASFLALLAIGGDDKGRWIKFYAVSLLLGMVIVGVFFIAVPQFAHVPMVWENRLADPGSTPDPNIASGRMYLWKKAFDMMESAPFIGAGPMHFAYEFHEEGAHPHNLAMQLGAEWGVVAMAGFIGLLLYAYFQFALFARENRRAEVDWRGRTTVQGLLAALTIISVYAMIDGLFVMPFSQMWVVLLFAWALSVFSLRQKRDGASSNNSIFQTLAFRVVIAIAIPIALASVALFGFPGIGHTKERSQAFQDSAVAGVYFPRFWLQGWIGLLPQQAGPMAGPKAHMNPVPPVGAKP